MTFHSSRVELLDMLTYCRPHDSPTERLFVQKYIADLSGAEQDPYGNWHVIQGESRILWSCHTDTVHREDGRQTLHYDAPKGAVHLSKRSRKQRNCLGADDTAGVFLARQMILAGVPGRYVFHCGEECGGLGSSDLARCDPAWFDGVDFAIALDRQGYRDVITHQGGRRTASDAFALSLANQLNLAGLEYAPSSHGIYTDTAEYASLVPECTNLSVGYWSAHSSREILDVVHLERLLTALERIDESALVAERTPQDDLVEYWGESNSFRWTTVDNDSVGCQYCGLWYFPASSTAADQDTYCSADCETQWYLQKPWADHHDDVYLDPTYADVQKALRRLH